MREGRISDELASSRANMPSVYAGSLQISWLSDAPNIASSHTSANSGRALPGEITVCAGPVLNDEPLAKAIGQPLCHEAGK